MTHAFHIAIAQINPIVGNLTYNADKIRKIWADSPSDLVVFPELALCGYTPEDLILRPSFMDEVERIVAHIVHESAECKAALILPAPHRIDGAVYNAAHLIHDGKILATVLKHHLPNYGVFDERRVFASGPMPEPVSFMGHSVGLIVCEDLWFADVAAHLKTRGATMLIAVNASPFEDGKQDVRIDLARARVTETGLPLIYLNLCGGQDEIVFDGASFVMNESGTLVLQAEEFAEGTYNTAWEKTPTGHWLCLTDTIHERNDRVAGLYKAAMTGLRDYVVKNGFPGVLIGLSGGIDSALVAAMAVDALGPDAVHAVMMPSRFTSKESIEDAAAVAKALGIVYDTIPIEQPVEAFNRALGPHLPGNPPEITFENLQSRSRGLILMALSNASGRMVLSTGNKSEMAVGYATLYGDMCGGFNPLKDLYKTDVYALSRYRNTQKPEHGFGPHGPVIAERVITKAPTAELKSDQTDQDTLPPYDILDDILRGLIEQDLGIDAIVARGHDPETVKRVARMLYAAEYKRRQAPPGVKLTSRAFGRERRYPITNGFRD